MPEEICQYIRSCVGQKGKIESKLDLLNNFTIEWKKIISQQSIAEGEIGEFVEK